MVVFTGKLTYGMTVEEMREFIDSILNASDLRIMKTGTGLNYSAEPPKED